MNSENSKDRSDIHGLRAIAVIAVLLFHLGVPHVTGGYVGVDVFFVISGYLITKSIMDRIEADRFSFVDFYVRRARRLFPALFFTLCVSSLAAAELLSPSHLENFGRSLASASLGLSNFRFWNESGYFDIASLNKPLLHTWSLGVEEQFYLVWPALLFAVIRFNKRFLPVIISLLAVVCLVFGERWARIDHNAAYYLPWFRVPELALGALVLLLERRYRIDSKALCGVATFAGLALIIAPVILYSPETTFPGVNAMYPCAGVAILIYVGRRSALSDLYSNPAFAKVGEASYSLYLIHWPIIVFYRYYTLEPLTNIDCVAVVAASVASALLMRRYIEIPFLLRRPAKASPFVFGATTLSAIVVVVSFSMVHSLGWQWRIPSDRILGTPEKYMAEETTHCGGAEASVGPITCLVDRHSDQDIYVFGDSHGRHLVAGLEQSYPSFNIKIMYFPGCFPHFDTLGYTYNLGTRALNDGCKKHNAAAMKFFSDIPPTNIIISFWTIDYAYSDTFVAAFSDVVRRLKSFGHNVKVLGDVIRPGKSLVDCYAVPLLISDVRQETRCRGDMDWTVNSLRRTTD